MAKKPGLRLSAVKELGVRFGGAKGCRKMEGVMTNDPENKSATIPVAPQAEAAAAHFVQRTAKPHVWAEPMLTALITGVKGDAAGFDHVSVREFAAQCPENIRQLSDLLRARDYDPSAIRRKYIPKPGTKEERPLGIPTVGDRTVQASLLNVIERIFECGFAELGLFCLLPPPVSVAQSSRRSPGERRGVNPPVRSGCEVR